MDFPNVSLLHLPKMLLNGRPFHSPVEMLIAFSSWTQPQLNQQEALGRRERCQEVFAAWRRMFFLLLLPAGPERGLVSELLL